MANKIYKSRVHLLNKHFGRGGGQMVRVLTFYSDDPSSIPPEYSFYSIKLFEKYESKQKRSRELPMIKVTNDFFVNFAKVPHLVTLMTTRK